MDLTVSQHLLNILQAQASASLDTLLFMSCNFVSFSWFFDGWDIFIFISVTEGYIYFGKP